MSAFVNAFRSAEAQYAEFILAETWGHLAPKKDREYSGHIVWALGIHGDDCLNPMVLQCELDDLPSSPWFYESMIRFLQSITEGMPREEISGTIWRWDGTFRNYKFSGQYRQLSCEGLGKTQLPPIPRTRLTAKDFNAFAAEIRKLKTLSERQNRLGTLLSQLKASNPKFDEKRFRLACNA